MWTYRDGKFYAKGAYGLDSTVVEVQGRWEVHERMPGIIGLYVVEQGTLEGCLTTAGSRLFTCPHDYGVAYEGSDWSVGLGPSVTCSRCEAVADEWDQHSNGEVEVRSWHE